MNNNLTTNKNNNVNRVIKLTEYGASIDSNDHKQLDDAIWEGNIEMVKHLVDNKVNLNAIDDHGNTLLHSAAQKNDVEILKVLIKGGADVNIRNIAGDTPLFETCSRHGDITVAKYLINVGADLNLQNTHGHTALHFAAINDYSEMIKLLIEEGADVNIPDLGGLTPLSFAMSNGNIISIKYLIDGGADINIAPQNLTEAIRLGYLEIAKDLIDNSANDLTKSKVLLAATDNIDFTRYLVERGADVNFKDNIGDTPLHHAVSCSNVETVQYLLEQGAVLNCKNIAGRTPLINAVSIGDTDIIKYLIEEGADINIQTRDGYSPLHKAVINGNLDIIKLLIDKGAKLEIYNNCGHTPLYLAKYEGKTEIVDDIDNIASNLSCSKDISFNKTNIKIKYDLAGDQMNIIEKSVKDAVDNFKDAFNSSERDIKINVYVFNNHNDFKEYSKKNGSNVSDSILGYAKKIDMKVNAAEVHVYLDSQGNVDQDTLKHEIGHAMNLANLGLVEGLPKAMHEAIANYVAGLENGKHINDYGDKEALITIKNKDLKPNEILNNNYPGNHYYSEAEQVVKFLENKYPGVIDDLLKSLSTHPVYYGKDIDYTIFRAKNLVEDFLTKLKGYDQEFKEWVTNELKSIQHKYVEVNYPNEMQDQAVSQEKPVQVIDKQEQAILSNKDQPDEPIVAEIVEHNHEIAQSFLSSILNGIQNLFGSIFSTVSGWFSTSEEINSIPNVTEERNINIDESKNLYLLQQDNIRSNESVKLADTILKVVNDEEYNHEGKQKANIMIDHYDLKSLHKRAEGEEKRDIESLETKLHKQKHVLCSLPQEKYYFLKDKFCISDNEHGKCVPISKDIVDIKIMRSENSYKLVILDKTNNTIVKAESIENELFSNSINLINKVNPYNQNEYLIGEMNDQKAQTNKISLNQDLDQRSITYSPVADTNLNILQNDELI
ncbi:ankyrin repeat domain-containing protein [Wolbachia endosymbiont of Tetranychus urticae]|uniref:ankyrin repeat domain-containing protein n=1 Tax=Wolbachia endosymbiont of Tetranychus urticae TaxID=169184 RepID=UPI00397E52A8